MSNGKSGFHPRNDFAFFLASQKSFFRISLKVLLKSSIMNLFCWLVRNLLLK